MIFLGYKPCKKNGFSRFLNFRPFLFDQGNEKKQIGNSSKTRKATNDRRRSIQPKNWVQLARLSFFEKFSIHQMKNDPRSYERNLCNCVRSLKKFRTSTGFEPVTWWYWCDALTNWAVKPLMLGASQLCVQEMNVIDVCEINHIRTAETKSNEEWSSQLWTQFIQLRKKPEKNSELLELFRSLCNNHDLLALSLEEGGYFLVLQNCCLKL